MIERIRYLCSEHGITFAGLEKALSFANGSIAKTNEKTQISRIKTIADYFNVSVDYLITGTESPENGFSDDERKILALYRKFNAQGKSEAIRRLTELSRLTEYTDRGKRSYSSRIG